jgi:hypothetical protein
MGSNFIKSAFSKFVLVGHLPIIKLKSDPPMAYSLKDKGAVVGVGSI